MKPIPASVKILFNWGFTKIISETEVIEGEHIMVEGERNAIADWLRPQEGFWLGQGPPMLQSFKIVHIA